MASHKSKAFSLIFLFVTLMTVGVYGLINASVTTAVSAGSMQAVTDPATTVVQQAWDKAQQSDSYTFDTHIEQTSYPVPALSNVGRQPQTDDLYLMGQRDQTQDLLEMTLWQHARGTVESGVSVRSQDGRTYRRAPTGEWEEQDNFSDLFAPGNDPLTFLQTTKNIAYVGPDTRELGGLTFTYDKYSFELDTTEYARVLRQQLEAQLEQFGALPAGMTLETPAVYRQITGQGELWLDEDGLPQRLVMTLTIPPQGNNGQAIATITTDLSGFDRALIAATAVPFWQSPQTWWQTHQTEVITRTQQTAQTAVWLFVGIGLLLLILPHWRSRRFYAGIVTFLILSMLFSPLLQAAHANDFQDNLQAAQAKALARQASVEAQANLQAELTATDWNPNQNPLTNAPSPSQGEGRTPSLSLSLSPALASTATLTDTTDTDGDGLIDLDEKYRGTCPYLGAPEGCAGVIDPTDTDGDSLSDGVEVHDLGTNPDNADTDLDSIPDNLEISGFDYNGQTWYLNPLEEDSNKDGLIDGLECRIRTTLVPAEFDPTGICPDTDNDGTPDVFDDDNDGDNVHDKQDISPFTASAGLYGKDSPLEVSFDNLALDKPVFVDFQVRPETDTNLYLYNHVLDWPSGDYEGQIQRFLDTTWADTANSSLRSTSPNAANGDIRLVPMLEITMPYTDGHYANLPITTTAPLSRIADDPVDNWLDSSQLDPFGISVNDNVDAPGTLNAYIPLTQVTDRYGTPEAFSARMLYRPSQGTNGRADWGTAHQVRLIWLVQMITDQCPEGADEVREENNGALVIGCYDSKTGATVAREDVMTVGHIYQDTWQLTGLDVTEEHDFDLAIMYENPALDTDLTFDDQLLVASWNLNSGFLTGRDCDSKNGQGVCVGDGKRDVTVENMATAVTSWFTDTAYINVQTYLNYDHSAYLSYLISAEVTPLLDTAFGSYTTTQPTLLYAHDSTSRQLNLDSFTTDNSAGLITTSNGAYQFDLKPKDIVTQTLSTVSWTPYQHVNGSWQAANIENYLTRLDSRLQLENYFQPEDNTAAAKDEAEQRRTWVQLYYTTLWQGVSSPTATAGQALHTRPTDPDIPDTFYDPLFLPGTDFGATILAQLFFSTRGTLLFTSKPYMLVTVVTWVALGLLFFGNEQQQHTAQIILAVVNLIVVTIYAMFAISSLIASGLSGGTRYPAMGLVGLLIVVGLTWGVFFFQKGNLNKIETEVATSIALAATIFAIFLFVLSALGFGLLGILLSLIDAIFVLLGKKGPTQYIIEAISGLLYDIDMSVANLDSSNRLDMQLDDMAFVDNQQGFRVSNTLRLTMGITNTIKYPRNFAGGGDRVAKRNIFTYTLETNPTTFTGNLPYWNDTATDQWQELPGRYLRTNYQNEATVPLSSVGAGLNQPLELYYREAFSSGYQGCWNTAGLGNKCSWKDFQSTIHYPLGNMLTFDIFPGTVTAFARMNWSNTEPPLPRQADADFDGLIDAGGDPDQGAYDMDGDLLSDRFEISNGYDPTMADGDGDGLNDRQELDYGTNPFLPDTDGDGLNDRIETVEGWNIVYNGNQLIRVWSDPLKIDADEDGLSDLEEFVFGFNPWAATDPSLITQLVQFDNLGVTEMGAPELLLQFEDNATSAAFYDSAGEGHHAVCTGDECPVVSQNGRYGQAAQFDGIDDYLETPFVIDPAATAFTAATWFKLDSHSNQPMLIQQLDGSGNGRAWLRVMADGTIQTFLGNSALNTTSTITDGQWHHAALVYDGATAQLYLDGVLENSAPRTAEASDGRLWLGRHKFIANTYLDGMLDDVVALDQALDVAGIRDLMNGRFNPNDNLLAPNTTLQYQATVTNTSATTATGFLAAKNSYFDPAVRYPTAAYSFEPENRLRFFANDTGDDNPVICIADGTCPAVINSVYEQGLWFNGTTHTALLPALSVKTINDNFNLSFWVNLDAYPAPGERMMLVDTDSDEIGAIDIYINSDGNVVVDVVGHPDGPSVDSRVLDLNNHHISLNGHFVLYVDGTPQYLNNWSIGRPDAFQIGPGRLGGNIDGGDLFYGQIDELAFFNNFKTDPQVNNIKNGNYNGHTALYRFRNDTISLGYDNLANDVRAATCPSEAACPSTGNGRYGSGLSLDGIDDYLLLDTPVDPALEPFTAALWFNTTGYGNEPIFLQQADGSGTGRTWLGIRSDGRLYSYLGGSYLNGTTSITPNSWHHAAVTYDGTTLRLYLDGVEEAAAVRPMEASDGEIELGRHKSFAGRYFTGQLDELVMLKTAVTPDKVQLLMNSQWPMIDVLDEFVPYSATAVSTQIVSGLAPVNPYATTSVHRFDQEVEAALVLQTAINYPVIDPYASDLQVFIPFEDEPGSQVIDNLIAYPNPSVSPDQEAYCQSAAHCPTLGLRGQVERSAYFDGRDDYLFLDTNQSPTYGPGPIRTVAAWVKAESGTIFDLRFGSTSYWFTLDMDHLEISRAGTLYSISYDLPRNAWFHLAMTIDNSNVGHVYVNGVEIASGPARYIDGWNSAWGYIGSTRDGSNLLQGSLDDLRMYGVPFSTADVVNLYETSAPLMRFEFDEDEAATLFEDNSVNQYVGHPRIITQTVDSKTVYQPSPAPGTKGRIGNGALFDGHGFVQINDAVTPAALTNNLTIMGWIRPQTVGAGIERLFGAGNEATVNGYNIALDNGKLLFQTNGVQQYLSNVAIEPDLWQHIAVVFDSNNDAHFYLNGAFQQTITGALPANANTDDPLFIGARTDINGNIIQAYTGMIDELAVYGRSLTAAELYGIYLRELRWYRDKTTTYLTIDTDSPTIQLLSDAAYWPNGYIQLAVATTDATSAVSLLDFGLKAPGATEFSWHGAPPCAESSVNAAWCPYFDSSQLSGEGTYELQFRAVDAVGNETFSPVTTLYVDDTPPTAAGSYTGQWLQPTAQDDARLQWTVTLSGTLNDPDLATTPSVAGSGVVTDSVMVELVDGVNGRFSDGPQTATVNGGNWAIDYQISGLRPQGAYSVALTLADQVGNVDTITVGTIRMDERPSTVDFDSWNLPGDVISQTLMLSGTAGDLPDWGDSVVEHHFEEPAGTTIFYNTASSQFYTPTHSVCTVCPASGIPGLFGNGVQFDGVDDRIDIPFVINPMTATLAASVWFNVTNLNSSRTILQQLDGSGSGRTWLYVESSNGKLQSHLGGSALVGKTAVTTGQWHHAAVTYDGATLRLYLDGRLEASDERALEAADGAMQLGVNKTDTSRFLGMLDEFTLYDRALSEEEIYALAQGDAAGVTAVEIAIEPADFVTKTVSPMALPPTKWISTTISSSGANLTDWQYALPANMEGFYEIHLRSSDGFNNVGRNYGVWRGLIDMVSPTITVTAQHLWQNGSPVTEYSFTFRDFILDDSSYTQPCAVGDLVVQTYNDATMPYDGLPYEVSASCQVAGHEYNRDFTVCDSVGHCTTVNPFATEKVCAVSDNQAYTFGNLDIFIEPGGLGDIACLQVTHMGRNHPEATPGILTGEYWAIEALNSINSPASSYTATLTITVPFTPDANDKLCRYTGSGWDCAADSFDAGNQTITRNAVTQFSHWAVGNDVGPTAVTLGTLTVTTANQIWVWFIVFMMGLATAVLWWRRNVKGLKLAKLSPDAR